MLKFNIFALYYIMDNHLLNSVISEELLNYFRLIEASIAHKDEKAKIKYYQNNDILKVFITPSSDSTKENLIKNLLGTHRERKIPIIFSKSINIQKIISYEIKIK